MLEYIQKLLLIKPSSLGDIVHSLAFVNTLKENFPSIKIHWIVSNGFEDILTKHPLIDRVIVINKDKWKSFKHLDFTIKEFSRLKKQLKKESYDIAVDLQGLLRSGIITWLSKAPIRVGFKEARELSHIFYNKKVSVSIDKHAVLRYLEVARFLGCRVNSVKFPLPHVKTPEWLEEFENFVVIIPSARWQSKNWPVSYFVELIKMLPYNFLIIGTKFDETRASEIEKYSEGKAKSVAGKTSLKDLISLLNKSLFVITPDTGTMHLAVACGKNVVAIFGPTKAERTGPFGNGHLIIQSEASCSPCFKKSCSNLKCMESITPEMVYNKIVNWRRQ
ncbi:lipopolysaccharide heptosyltransferase I [Thermodesulfovibrio thiophilus]|uniref:lipopolysaccharide heptosyltransferase I n=1 Tax=Thermodesulfovibrio thiophilus TaxID=340095 RepID=UPI0017F6496C|nr:lipopolysaccharide heptosyltransferase I [Thermodesulfovibrio thiophilus]HHW20993.1 lipopolysaccharide heptosyltransferase I [Thermodesulfovibrio thiophilus]